MVKGVKFEWSRNDESSREEKLARNKTEWKMTGGSQGKRKEDEFPRGLHKLQYANIFPLLFPKDMFAITLWLHC